MFHKIKDYLEKHPKQYELLRYVVAGGLTTVLSMVISYGMEFLLAARPERTAGFLQWVIDCINAATARQVMIANAVSWVIAVLFAFWINRKMVFQVKGGTGASVLRELGEFALGRVLSFALFEEGMAYLLKLVGGQQRGQPHHRAGGGDDLQLCGQQILGVQRQEGKSLTSSPQIPYAAAP